MTNSYHIPSAQCETEETIKKSRFISLIAHTPGREAALSFIESVRQQHPDARHHCWAFIAGAPDDCQQWGFSDDGEPSGTAGKPILARLQGSGLGELTAVVVRYSGGIKLGTGGLVRAYGGGVGSTLAQLETKLKVIQTRLLLTCSYDQQADVQHILARYSGLIENTEYGEQLDLIISVPSSQVKDFSKDLTNHFKGQLSTRPADK
ncbi:YigZ family protein [Sansalvadorimonas sp. 2012CJ34-2]|uniref:YigZ family protein n=1 Tax=Parendozoicomonas callyspongiae TaxID=2942213 RepID=A0ABT0PBL7_9GAMM|nr:YigZ family protein [Sansalvadorimonas sp. 2012CJ34-2]MCL6268421.1 YigZ family protein [Sansalvadorimonas sp. 2012CJ34-2]